MTSLKGIKFTEEHKRRISESATGRKLSEETKRKVGESSKLRVGKNHWHWMEDRSKLKQSINRFGNSAHREWSRNVKNRDGWKCRMNNGDCCGRMESHHILGFLEYPELRYDLNNGITLCHFHHPRKVAEVARLTPYFQELMSTQV